MLLRTGAVTLGLGLGLGGWPLARAATAQRRKVLFFTKSSGYEHSVIRHQPGEMSHAGRILAELGPKHGIDFTFSKDGSLFTPAYLAGFDAFFFYTTGDLTVRGGDGHPPMTPAGKAAFLEAIHNGKGFIGSHSATDTFHTNEPAGTGTGGRPDRYQNYGEQADPYVQMIGAEFIVHGTQQKSRMRVVDPIFPGMKAAGEGFELHEEWYSLKDFARNLHVLLIQETEGMTGEMYRRPPYPATWARMHGQGRVFYTSMGHREDVWTNPVFQEILLGGVAWAVRNVEADATPNIDEAAPGYAVIPPGGRR